MMPPPGSGTTPPGTTCRRCTTGQIEVTVYLQTVCWDTDRALGVDSPDRPFSGVTVTVKQGTTVYGSKLTNDAGKATFDGLNPGSYSVEATKTGFDDVTDFLDYPDDGTRNQTERNATVAAHTTTQRIRVMRRQGMECKRKHSAVPAPTGNGGPSLGAMFWEDEPWILVLRDILWIALLLATVIVAICAFALPTDPLKFLPGAICVAALCLAYWAYIGNIIFGMGFGIPSIIVAALAFIALTVLMIVSAATAGSIPWLPKPDPYAFPLLAATWFGFFYAFVIAGRKEHYNHEELLHVIISAIVGAVVALVFALVFFFAAKLPVDGMLAVAIIVAVIGGLLLGGLAGLLGFCFANEGKTRLSFDITDFELPYAGERYCVQGHRGFISHYFKRNPWGTRTYNQDEEGSYDFSLPVGARLLNCKEGHIVAYDDQQSGNVRSTPRNEQANYIAVRHPDKTVAKYLHLDKDGIIGPAWNKDLGNAVTVHTVESDFDPDSVETNPLHVHTGQVLCANGDIGISMFPHLHLYLLRAGSLRPASADLSGPVDNPPDSNYHAFHYMHGRCWSMRKYRSTNVDKGLLVIPPNSPPFKPGGPTTDGTPIPGMPPPNRTGASDLPTPPTPPAPGAPPVPGGTPPTPGT